MIIQQKLFPWFASFFVVAGVTFIVIANFVEFEEFHLAYFIYQGSFVNLIIFSGYTFIYLKFLAFKKGAALTLGQLFTAENKATIDKAARDVLLFLIYII